uniref:NAC domain-containing protein n=1 Tax=Oryza brachyantha TaxID=4533 RepID=J3LUN0_ORYBR
MADGIALDPGFRFRPSDDGLITLFLRPKIAEEPFEERIVNNADVYSEDPAELVGQHTPAPGTQGNKSVWYFFCPPRYTSKRASSGGRRQRAVGGGGGGGESVWKSEGGKKPVKDADGRRVRPPRRLPPEVILRRVRVVGVGTHLHEAGVVHDGVQSRRRRRRSREAGALQVLPLASRGGTTQRAAAARGRERARAAELTAGRAFADDGVAGGGSEDEFLQTEQQQPELQLDFDLEGMEALLSSPVDENLTRQFSTTTDEQCMRYLFHDEPLPCAPTVEVAGAGIEDGLIQTEHEKTQSPPAFYLEGVLPAPTDQNLIGQSSTAMEEQCTRYPFDDDIDVPCPWTSTPAEVVDGGRGDELIQTANGLRADADIITLLAAGQTVDDIFGADQ